MPNLRNASTSNIVFPSCSICEKSVSDKDDAIQYDICQAWIHLKCNKLNHIDYKYLQGSSDPWFCLYCCISLYSRNVRKCFQQERFDPFNTSSQSCSFV